MFFKDEMADVKQICRLCLDIISVENGEVIEEIKKEKLKVLQINVDFDISDNAVSCHRCLEKLQECFDFKSACFQVENCITPFINADVKMDIKNVFQKEIFNESVTFCRLCMLLIEDDSFSYTGDSKDGVFLKDMIGNCFPEVALNTVPEHLICKRCQSNIKIYSGFMKTCHEVEQRIQNYCQVVAGRGKVVLEDVLEFKYCDRPNKPIDIKKECFDFENDMTTMEFFESELTTSIKYEDFHIKDELDIKVEENEFDYLRDCNNSEKNGPSKREMQIEKSAPKGKIHFCPKCPYSSKKSSRIEKHIRSHSDNSVHKCFMCSFVADIRSLLKEHVITHRGATKRFGCTRCPYETDHKPNLERHFINHKDESEVQMYKCPLCTFNSKHKMHVVRHHKLQHEVNVEVHKCTECSFSTKYRKNLGPHMLTHGDPNMVNKFKCEKCPYWSKWSGHLHRHMATHSDEQLYSCDQCTYSSNIKEYLNRHNKRVHHTHGEEAKLQCNQCDFRAKNKKYLQVHKNDKHDPKRPLLKCDQCEYTAKQKTNIIQHRVSHMELGETMVYYCATCDYKTKYKRSLPGHMVRANICLKTKKENNERRICSVQKVIS